MSYADLVATAAVGVAQRPVPPLPAGLVGDGPADQPPAVTLLDAAAAYAVARRASLCVAEGVATPPAAAPDPAPTPPERFSSALARLVTDEQPAGGGVVEEQVAEALGWVAAAGWRLPERLLVPVLALTRRPKVAQAVGPVLGERGRWLVAHHLDWSAAVSGAAPVPDDEPLDERTWHEGVTRERLAHLTRLRRRDPDAARALVEATWKQDSAADRAAFVAVVAAQPTPADLPFLETALADRSKKVAAAAREGLLLLPGSVLVERMRARARQAVLVEPGRQGVLGLGRSGPRVRFEAPPDAGDDPDATRDGLIEPTWAKAAGENRLNAVVAAIPPAEWPALVGVPASALLQAEGTWSVRAGLAAAAERWHDQALAADLVAAGVRTAGVLGTLDLDTLAQVLDGPDAVVPHTVDSLVSSWPTPWPAEVAHQLSGWVLRQARSRKGGASTVPDAVWSRAATAVPVLHARGWAQRLRDVAADAELSPHLQRRIRAAAATLTLRAAMYDDARAHIERRTGAGS